jgi:CheY-like chemotaxis protein
MGDPGKKIAILFPLAQSIVMTRPLVLFVYERLLPGGQLVNCLQDLGYRVQSLADPTTLVEQAEREKPLLVIVDLEPRQDKVCAAIARLKGNSATAHLPVIAFASAAHTALQESARAAGATLVVHDSAMLLHLNHFLDQALQLD